MVDYKHKYLKYKKKYITLLKGGNMEKLTNDEDPLQIYKIDNILTDHEIQHIINLGNDKMKRSTVADKKNIISSARTSSTFHLSKKR